MSSNSLTINSRIQLNDGNSIPRFGLGCWRSNKNEVENIVEAAILAGYRHIDEAYVYGNEEEAGRGIKAGLSKSNGSVKRSDLFITSKLWNTKHSPAAARECLKQSLERLQLDYLDLWLIHWPVAWKDSEDPFPTNPETKEKEFDNETSMKQTWQALESFVKEGLVKSIGVSNFTVQQVEEILQYATIKPVVNQVECHPYFQQQELRQKLAQLKVHVTSYCPLGNLGRPESDPNHGVSPLKDEVIVKLAQKHSKSPAQIIIRWHLQSDLIVIPKTVQKARLEENAAVFDFTLSQEDMKEILGLGARNLRFVNPDFLPGGKKLFGDD
jgi:aldehyde reductase